ncbi:hypothetical protein BN381_220019 [Candidatus Microthrix parvicella RN1]|uniref:Uncharacterized protein n=1 Tax=Candidatus Neomicrothrix parvicella RN1 TaxID=1229780 RepID=R4YYM8_9ACTN|nr:hypothetical protein BN381_220019 [Candidatus Microthrix parvicella RN1]
MYHGFADTRPNDPKINPLTLPPRPHEITPPSSGHPRPPSWGCADVRGTSGRTYRV